MPTDSIRTRVFGWTTLVLGALCAVIVISAFIATGSRQPNLTGRLLPDAMQGDIRWKVITPEMLINGTALPGNTNVILALPPETQLMPNPITRKVLFGTNDPDVRYWGYCLPDDYDRERALKTNSLPGKIFLSEGERKAREEEFEKELHSSFSIDKNLTEEDLNELRTPPKGRIYHQIETFEPYALCYVMSERDLPVGIDRDNDMLNEQLEKVSHTDNLNPDTDGDGLSDGCELTLLKTSPLQRDTDGDGLIDSFEDTNGDCIYKAGAETDPHQWDTDRDGLPDGYMKMFGAGNTRFMGEDKNLNGVVDAGETDPRKWSTAGDNISDGDLYWKCIFNNEKPNPNDC
jgi:hypothetical protein